MDRGRTAPGTARWILVAALASLLGGAGYFAYGIITKSDGKNDSARAQNAPQRILQLDVLNGCGADGIGAKFTSFLRTQGFDVVEMKNYHTFSIRHTLVIDRVGNLSAARRVAETLGIAEERVIQQLSPDYFVDVSVIIGSDYPGLRVNN